MFVCWDDFCPSWLFVAKVLGYGGIKDLSIRFWLYMRGGGGGYYIAGGEIGRQTSEGKGKGVMQTVKARGGEGEEGNWGMSMDVVSVVPLGNTRSPLISFLLACVLATNWCLIIRYKALHLHAFNVLGWLWWTCFPCCENGVTKWCKSGKIGK